MHCTPGKEDRITPLALVTRKQRLGMWTDHAHQLNTDPKRSQNHVQREQRIQ